MQNAVIYARYSSHSQREVSIDQQVNACREFAARGGIDVLDVYADRATTGTNDRRPAFQKMISDAKKGSGNMSLSTPWIDAPGIGTTRLSISASCAIAGSRYYPPWSGSPTTLPV